MRNFVEGKSLDQLLHNEFWKILKNWTIIRTAPLMQCFVSTTGTFLQYGIPHDQVDQYRVPKSCRSHHIIFNTFPSLIDWFLKKTKKYCSFKIYFCWNIWRVKVMVFNATVNNISVILWQSVLLVEETGVPRENHWPVASHWQTLSHNVVSSTPRHEQGSSSQL